MEKVNSVDIYPKFSTPSSPSNNELVFLFRPDDIQVKNLVTSKPVKIT